MSARQLNRCVRCGAQLSARALFLPLKQGIKCENCGQIMERDISVMRIVTAFALIWIMFATFLYWKNWLREMVFTTSVFVVYGGLFFLIYASAPLRAAFSIDQRRDIVRTGCILALVIVTVSGVAIVRNLIA